jgi:hypothetical protein
LLTINCRIEEEFRHPPKVRDIEIFITSFGELTDTLLTKNDGMPNGDEAEDK